MAHSDGQGKPFGGLTGFLRKLWGHVWGSLATLTLLTMLALGLHHLHFFEWTEGIVRRKVLEIAVDRAAEQSMLRRRDPASDVNVLTVDAMTRMTHLEVASERLADKGGMVERVAGVRPIDRCKFADLLEQLAAQLALPQNRRYLKVVGIDVDIAPLSEDAPDVVCAGRMADAVALLRKHVTVVAIVMDRETDRLRQVRNDFFAGAGAGASAGQHGLACTRDAETTKNPNPPNPPKTAKDAGDGKEPPAPQPLYLASPRVFHTTYSYPIEFPFELKEEATEGEAASHGEPAHVLFPSLSNLLLASAFRSGHAWQRSSTSFCDEIWTKAARNDRLLIEDQFSGRLADRCNAFPPPAGSDCRDFALEPYLTRYESRQINWRWLYTDSIQRLTLSGAAKPKEKEQETQEQTQEQNGEQKVEGASSAPPTAYFREAGSAPGTDYFAAAVMILGVDGGSGYDKFVAADRDPTPGSMIHALQILSVQDASHVLYLQSVWTLLADFAVGLLFLLAWKACSLLVDRFLSGTGSRTVLRRILPVAIGIGLGLGCVYLLSPWLLGFNVWANPMYLLAGLVLHAYVEGAEEEEEHGAHGPDFTFGLGAVWDLLRSHHRWERPMRHPWSGRAHHSSDLILEHRWMGQFVDACVCAAAKLLVIGFACKGLLEREGSSDPFDPARSFLHDPALLHWGGWGVLLLFVIACLAFWKRPINRNSRCADTSPVSPPSH